MADQMFLAKASLESTAEIMMASSKKPVTLAILVVDASTSMRKYGDAPLRCVNATIQGLKKLDGADQAITMVVAFSRTIEVISGPQKLLEMNPLHGYSNFGGTKLYEAAGTVLSLAHDFDEAAERHRCVSRVAISLISDGWDRGSAIGAREDARALAEQGRMKQFLLQAIGIGIDSKVLARDLGFEEELAYTAEPSVRGIQQATDQSSRLFSLSMLSRMPHENTPTPR